MRKRRLLSLALAVGLLLGGCGQEKEMDSREEESGFAVESEEKDFDWILAAEDTPDEVIEELKKRGLEYTVYEEGAVFADREPGEKVSIYLCPGTYQVEAGDFLRAEGRSQVTIQGAGTGETLICARSGVRKNKGTGIRITGGEEAVTVRGLKISGFEYGIQIRDASGVVLEDLFLEGNRYAGLRLENASGCRIDRCIFQENGEPGRGDTGYGLMIDADSGSNTGTGNGYRNNGNRNAVDCPALWDGYQDQGNEIGLESAYTLAEEEIVLRDPLIEAQTAKPGENSLRFEAEDCSYFGAGEPTQGKMPESSEGSYVVLYDGGLTFRIQVPEEGYYRLFVIGGSDDGNSKCDRVKVNDGPEYLTSFPWQGEARWQLSQPGLEVWTNNVLTPSPPLEGFWFEKGENTVTITANWGYCAYDCIYLDRIDGEARE